MADCALLCTSSDATDCHALSRVIKELLLDCVIRYCRLGSYHSHDIDPKLPTWDGQWQGFTDGTKDEDLPLLGPRLAANLSGRAFDWIIDVDRAKLRSDRGWAYLIEFLKSKRQHSKIDILSEEFSGFLGRMLGERKVKVWRSSRIGFDR